MILSHGYLASVSPCSYIIECTEKEVTVQTVEIFLCGQVSRLIRLQAASLQLHLQVQLAQHVLQPSALITHRYHFSVIYCKLCSVTVMANVHLNLSLI